jgi:hypothetical protein
MACDFRLTETNVKPPLKHDMFSCQFDPRRLLPVHGNFCWVASKRVTHFQLVAEIMSRGMSRRQCHTNLFLSLTQVNCYGSKALWPKTWG